MNGLIGERRARFQLLPWRWQLPVVGSLGRERKAFSTVPGGRPAQELSVIAAGAAIAGERKESEGEDDESDGVVPYLQRYTQHQNSLFTALN